MEGASESNPDRTLAIRFPEDSPIAKFQERISQKVQQRKRIGSSATPSSKKRLTKRKLTTTLVTTGSNKKRKVDKQVQTKKLTKKATKTLFIEEGVVGNDKLLTRSVPMSLVKAISEMNDHQKKSVCEIGFGSILELNTKHVPQQLGHWLVEHFDASKVCLKMADGECIMIEEKDVYIALGIPLGGQEVKASGASTAQQTWRQSFEKARPHPNDIVKVMMELKNGGDFFKQCFMVVLISTIIESNTNGTVNDSYFDALEDVEAIKSYNWCGFLLQRLIEAKKLWDNEKRSCFKGSLLFLALFYVDRVMCWGKKVPRPIPLFKEWTDTNLTNRQKAEMKGTDGFGCGRVLNAVDINAPETDEPAGCSRSPTMQVDCKKLTMKTRVWDQIQVMSTSISTFVELVKEAVVEENVDDEFKDITEIGMQLVGQGTSRSNNSFELPKEGCNSQGHDHLAWCSSQEEWWNDPKVQSCLDAVHEALNKKIELKKVDLGVPSFDLGIDNDGCNMPDSSMPSASHTKASESQQNLEPQQSSKAGEKEQMKVLDNAGECAETGRLLFSSPNRSESDAHMGEDEISNVIAKVTSSIMESESPAASVAQDQPNLKFKLKIGKGKEVVKKRVQPVRGAPSVVDTRRQEENDDALNNVPENVGKRVQPARKVMPTEDLKSPFLKRIVDLNQGSTKQLIRISNYIMSLEDKDEVLVKFKDYTLLRQHMRTLALNHLVGFEVIDAWTIHLNYLEQYKSASSPYRFFSESATARGSVAFPIKGGPKEQYKYFEEGMDASINRIGNVNLAKLDLMFFPILKHEHFYVICVNFKKNAVEVIDNGDPTIPFANKYENIPKNLVKMLCKYMEAKGQGMKVQLIRSAKIQRLEIKWTNQNNKIDCGVYCMRHMECYMGEQDWETGLKLNDNKNLARLRELYKYALINSEQNEEKERILSNLERQKIVFVK